MSSYPCPRCRAPIQAGQRFCGYCHLPLDPASLAAFYAQQQVATRRPVGPPPVAPRRSPGLGCLIVGVGGVFLALCAFSYYAVSSVRVPVSSGIIASRAATAVPTRPATAIPTPTATPAGPEEQIGILISKAMVAGGGQEVLSLDAFPLKDTGRYYVEVFVTVRDTRDRDFAAKNLAFLIHHALWTSGLPIGAVQVWVHPSSVTTAGAGLILVNARAGWPLMHTQPWDGVGPAVWADFLRKNRTVGATEEDAVWFHGTGGNAP